jgi:hypothetical protein
MAWLLDTNILSELRRPKPEPKVLGFIETLPLDEVHVSVVTLAELRFGIEIAADAARRADLNDWLTNIIRPMFEQRVLPITEEIMLSGGFLSRKAERPATPSPSQTSSLRPLRLITA